MFATSSSYPFAFFWLSACAIASPLSYLRPSPLLDIVNSTNILYTFLNVPLQDNITVPAVNVWPPAPPPNPLRYRVPLTQIAVKFSQQRLPAGGLEQPDVLTVVNAGLADCLPHAANVQVPLNPQDWTSGQMRLDRTARDSRPRERKLTYGDWCNALTAIQGFVEHYQGRDFLYNVYGEVEEFSLTVGALRRQSRHS